MRRRRLLAALASGTAALAGCSALGDADPAETVTPMSVPDDGNGDRPNTDTPVDPYRGSFDPPTRVVEKTVSTMSVGSSDDLPEGVRPIDVYLWNDVERERSLRVRVWRESASVSERRVAVPAGHVVAIELSDPGTYAVDVDGESLSSSVPVRADRFDCNSTTVWVRLTERGHETTSISTALACGDFEIATPSETARNVTLKTSGN